MNASFATHWLLICLCVMILLPLFASPLFASDLMQRGNVMFDWAHDRARMIQVSLVIVALGIAVMWWYR